MRGLDERGLMLIVLSFAPPALVGFALERELERRFGTPSTIAAALVLGATAMGLSDRRRSSADTSRPAPPTRCGSVWPRPARWFRGSRVTARR